MDHKPRRKGLAAATATALLTVTMVVLVPGAPSAADGNEAPANPAAFRSLTVGGHHSCALLGGTVRCWGANDVGQLGFGDIGDRGDNPGEMGAGLPAVSLGAGRTATAVTAGLDHTCALLDNARVKCWGRNDQGQLGLGDITSRGAAPNQMGDNLPTVDLGVGRTASAIAAGGGFTCALLDNARVKCWGANVNGQLGQGDPVNRGDSFNEMGDNLPPVDLGPVSTATAITAGGGHVCALLANATVKCWGQNFTGQLGLGDSVNRGDGSNEMGTNLPAIDLGTGRTAIAVSAAFDHTCALLDNATVKCWGFNAFGQLGLGGFGNRGDAPNEMGDNLPPVALGAGRTVTAVTTGHGHTCARLDNATVKCWGFNTFGQLGLGDVTIRGDFPNEMGDNLPAVDLGVGRTVTAVTSGDNSVCARLDNNAIKCWGQNDRGQLGQGDTANRGDAPNEMGDNLLAVNLGGGVIVGTITDSATSAAFGVAWVAVLRTSDFTVAGGSVSAGNGTFATGPLAPGTYFLYLVDPSGAHGDGFFGPPTPVTVTEGGSTTANPAMTPRRGAISGTVTDDTTGEVVAGAEVLAIGASGVSGGTVTAGNGTYTIGGLTAGAYRVTFIDPSGGHAQEYHANSPDFAGARPVSVTAGSTTTVSAALHRPASGVLASISSGESFTCVRFAAGAVKCWGANSNGQLGLGDTASRGFAPNQMGDSLPTVNLGTGRSAVGVEAGNYHACALLDNGSVKCWGLNNSGQLGLGDVVSRGITPGDMGNNLPAVDLGTGRTAVAVSAGRTHTCALLDNGTVKCWGFNTSGQLGLGDTVARGDNPGEMGDNLPAVDLGTGRTAVAIEVGFSHTCARLDNGALKCWGTNSAGQLGLGDTTNRGDAPSEMGDNLPAVSLGTGRTARSVSANNGFTCALLDNGTVKCWGSNGAGELGLGDNAKRGDGPNEMGDNLAAVNLGTGRTATEVRIGNAHSCARLDDGTTKCWGANQDGQLGLGDTVTRGDGPNEMGDNLPAVTLGAGRIATSINPAAFHTCAVLDNSTVKCWGSNFAGQLGQGDTVDRGDDPGEMGDALAPISFSATAVSGTVTDAASAGTLGGVLVVLLRTADFSITAGAVTDALGNYATPVAPGTYYLYLVDPTGTHNPGFFGPPTTVTVPFGTATDADPTMTSNRGTLAGTITVHPTAGPNPGAWVIAIGSSGITGGAIAAPNGTYNIPGLPVGTYRAAFLDPIGGGTLEYHDNSPDYTGATPFNITAGATTTINAALVHP